MIELKKYQCEHCKAVYDLLEHCRICEIKHIPHNELQIVRAVHSKCHPVEPKEGKWPDYIIIGKNEIRDKLYRYKFEGEENISGDYFTSDSYYDPKSK